ncbi:MAG: T9SS type A sorting domain-containing protein [Muribaculaceae bacterium]|nr:T9SS type A sorting domain-containing protein [Muribaculaceae bacterium]
MKKLLLTAALAVACGGFALADAEVVATLFSGPTEEVTWENTKSFDASLFENVQVGQYLYATYADGDGGIEFKSDATWLSGSYFINTFNNSQAKCYLTTEGVASLKKNGLELCGTFRLESLTIMNDGFVMPEGALWGGYFWVDNWNTLEIFKSAFSNYTNQKYMIVNLSDDNTNSGYFMKVLTNWGNPDENIPATVIADNDAITKTAKYAIIDLTDVNLSSLLENEANLKIQANPEGGNSFNITSVILTNTLPSEDSTQTPPAEPGEDGPENQPSTPENAVATIYEGEAINVSWETPLEYDAEELEDLKVGDYIYITFSATSDVIELKANGVWVPGTIFTWLGEGTPSYKYYVTADGLAAIQEYGLQITGAGFSVTGVYICNDGFEMPEGAVWGGYFWIDNGYNTLEIFKTAFANYDGERYLDIYLSDDNSDNTDYELKVLTQWDPETLVASNDEIEHTPSVATVDLEGINLPEMLADVSSLMIQGHTEGQPFNITAVVLRDGESSVISVLNGSEEVTVYNLQGFLMKKNVRAGEALENLPKGIYVIKSANGVKKVVK